MEKIYSKILISAGKGIKSNNKLAQIYGKLIVLVLSMIFHRQHYNYDEIVAESKAYNPNATSAELESIIKDVKKAYFKYRCTPREYFIFSLKYKTKAEIKELLFDIEKIVLITLVSDRKNLKLLNAKEKAYAQLSEFYKRDMIFAKNKTDISFEEFSNFALNHKEFISKPSNMSLARGIKVFRLGETIDEKEIKNIYDDVFENVPVIIEEFVHNDDYYAAFHPQSLNIVRAVCFRQKGEMKLYRAYLSLGCGDKDFANGAAGAIAVPIDYNTGITTDIGYTESLKTYDVHPDSGLPLKGIQLEKWDELVDLVKTLGEKLPTLNYVGWDLACTSKGWVIVEGNGNAGQTLYQLMEKKSIRSEFMKYYKNI